VRMERSLFAHKDCRAMRMASVGFIAKLGVAKGLAGLCDCGHKYACQFSVAGCWLQLSAFGYQLKLIAREGHCLLATFHCLII
jgi:hypothetical protein